VSPRTSLTTKVLPSRMLIRRGCTPHPLPARTISSFHVRPDSAFTGPYRGYCYGRDRKASAGRSEGSTVADTSEEPPSRLHRPFRIGMVAPPWFELPPAGYGGLEVVAAALVDGLVERGHEVTLFGAGNRTGTAARFVSTTGQLQPPRLGELMPAVLHTAQVNRLLLDGDFDVVHDHTTDGPMSATARPVPTVVTVHGAVNGEYGDYLAALGDSVRLVAISRAQRLLRPRLNWVATVHNALPPSAIDGGPA